MTLRGLILCGGTGTRLRPLTDHIPKQLLPVAGKPLAVHAIEELRAIGIEEIAIIVAGAGTPVRAALGDGSTWGAKLTYIEQPEPRGIGEAVLRAEAFARGEPLMLWLGDCLVPGGARVLAEACGSEFETGLLVAPVEDPARFGVVCVARRAASDGRADVDALGKAVDIATVLVEKSPHPPSNLAIVGVYRLGPEIYDACRAVRPDARGEIQITDALQWIVARGDAVRAVTLETGWQDVGRPEDLAAAEKLVGGGTHGASRAR